MQSNDNSKKVDNLLMLLLAALRAGTGEVIVCVDGLRLEPRDSVEFLVVQRVEDNLQRWCLADSLLKNSRC